MRRSSILIIPIALVLLPLLCALLHAQQTTATNTTSKTILITTRGPQNAIAPEPSAHAIVCINGRATCTTLPTNRRESGNASGQAAYTDNEMILLSSRGGQHALATGTLAATACYSTQAGTNLRNARTSDCVVRINEVEQSDAFSGAVGNSNLTPSNLGLEEVTVVASGTDDSNESSFGGGTELVTRTSSIVEPIAPAASVAEHTSVAAPRFE